MNWFRRVTQGIHTQMSERKEVPDGLWHRCSQCKTTTTTRAHKNNLWVCTNCDYHSRIGSEEYFEILFDKGTARKLFGNLIAKDTLDFTDSISYKKRLQQSQKKTGLDDAMQVAVGKLNGSELVVACMDFSFIGGSMGVVVGEKISRAIDHCLEHHLPLLIISKSGGARMMESAFSLMQMAKTSAKLTLLAEAKLPYISLMTDPTTGGVTASFAMLGDLNVAEPNALIGFAGPRVIKETIRRDLPDGFQTSEFLLEHGFLDKIIHRKQLKDQLGQLFAHFRQ
jgi:acetyl-CoA carboxylase carboxyl transferase subunit beta